MVRVCFVGKFDMEDHFIKDKVVEIIDGIMKNNSEVLFRIYTGRPTDISLYLFLMQMQAESRSCKIEIETDPNADRFITDRFDIFRNEKDAYGFMKAYWAMYSVYNSDICVFSLDGSEKGLLNSYNYAEKTKKQIFEVDM